MKKIFAFWNVLAVILLLFSCSPSSDTPDDDPNNASLLITTGAISSVTSNSALIESNIISDVGVVITARGIAWNTSTNPTIVNSKTIDGSGTGAFTSILTGLIANTTYYVRTYAISNIGTVYGNEVEFTSFSPLPSLTTSAISSITATTASTGGNVVSDGGGGGIITARGVVWSTNEYPTYSDSKTTDGGTMGIFTSEITGLTPNTTYYVRAYVIKSSAGITYGNQVSFNTVISLTIGAPFQGGRIAYILSPGDLGYITGETHGLIAAESYQSTGIKWGCQETVITGADATAIGTGKQNTIDIMNSCTEAGIAAKLCVNYHGGGYSDWYLPSKDELNTLYENRVAIGSYAHSYHWSSSEGNNTDYLAWEQDFNDGSQEYFSKNSPIYVRAVRSF